MTRPSMKLYRGLSAKEFGLASEKMLLENKKVWKSILVNREQGNFRYPNNLDQPIALLQKNLRLEYQHFTDSKLIAEGYARKVDGILIELNVSIEDILRYFDLELQNFARRKKKFEIVYRVKGSVLSKKREKWHLKIGRMK